jgi:hypothetical protein
MKAFNWRTALESRPIEDQDLEDTAKPAPDAGQIDGDTTTLGGQSKPATQPVVDRQDVQKIDPRPVDLADNVLAYQDRRGYEPLVSDPASKMAVDEQNIATEGLLERIKDAFSIKEHGIMEVKADAKENLQRIESMKTKMVARPGEVHPGADTIHLGAYATWIAINGKIIDDEASLLRELGRLKAVTDFITGPFQQALYACYDHMANQVLKLGESNLQQAKDNLAGILEQFKPKGFEQFLTEKKTTKENGNEYTDLESPHFMGSWYIIGEEQVKTNIVQGHLTSFRWSQDSNKVKKGDFKPLSKQGMLKVLELLNAISQTMSSYNVDGAKWLRFHDALDEFAYRYRYFRELSPADQKMVTGIYGAVKIVADNDRLWFADRAINHTVRAVLLYVEKSMRRIK